MARRAPALALAGLLALGSVSACSEQEEDQVEQEVEETGEQVEEGAEDAGDELQQQVEEGAEDAGEGG